MAGPMPGSTPTAVPTSTPRKAKRRYCGWNAVANPSSRREMLSMGDPSDEGAKPAEHRPEGQREAEHLAEEDLHEHADHEAHDESEPPAPVAQRPGDAAEQQGRGERPADVFEQQHVRQSVRAPGSASSDSSGVPRCPRMTPTSTAMPAASRITDTKIGNTAGPTRAPAGTRIRNAPTSAKTPRPMTSTAKTSSPVRRAACGGATASEGLVMGGGPPSEPEGSPPGVEVVIPRARCSAGCRRPRSRSRR